MKLTLTCWGGVGFVTGANFLLEGEPGKFLIDCGLRQGDRFAEEDNYKDFPYDPKTIDALFITHAHLDHIGRIPKLVHDGFRGKIYSTKETAALVRVMFDDALSLLTREAAEHHHEPLYVRADVDAALSQWIGVNYHEAIELSGGLSFFLKDAGHILGSAMIEFSYGSKKMLFTGDLGNSPSPLLRDTESPQGSDYLLMESVYGDRNHESHEDRDARFAKILRETIAKGGAVVMPTFSLERTQNILYSLNNLIEEKKIPSVPVFLDSPLAIKVTEIYRESQDDFNDAIKKEIASGDDIFNFPKLEFTPTARDSAHIEKTPNPKIILAGSGMSAGGRVTKHEMDHIEDPKSTILLVGYQSLGTLGRKLLDGAKSVTVDGRTYAVRAHIEQISGFSSHKDSDRLVAFVGETAESVRRVFVAMGEPKASLFLIQKLRDTYGIDATFPEQGKKYVLDF